MRNLLFVPVVLAAALLVLSGCAPAASASGQSTFTEVPTKNAIPPTSPAPSPIPSPSSTMQATADPISVAKAYVNTANSGDYQKALAFFSEAAVVRNGLGLFVGTQEISQWLENDVKTTRATPKEWKIEGALVVVTGQVSLARFKQAGIDAVNFQSEYMIDKNGKIQFFESAVTLTPDQQKIMQAAQANAAPVPTPEQNPVDVVKAYIEAANSGNYDQALAFYADDSAALVSNGAMLLSGIQQIAGWLKSDVQTTRATPQGWNANGNTVINTGTVSLDRFKKLGIDSVQYSTEYLVENGKIRFFYPSLILTPDQQAIIKAAQPTQNP